jgi:hypothetical protein
MSGATGLNDFPRQANGCGLADSDHPSPRTDPADAERLPYEPERRCSQPEPGVRSRGQAQPRAGRGDRWIPLPPATRRIRGAGVTVRAICGALACRPPTRSHLAVTRTLPP